MNTLVHCSNMSYDIYAGIKETSSQEFILIVGGASGGLTLMMFLIIILLCMVVLILKRRRYNRNSEMVHNYESVYGIATTDTTYDTINPNGMLELSHNEAYLKFKMTIKTQESST